MPIQVRWLVENQVLISHMSGAVGVKEISDYIEKSFTMRDRANEINGEYGNLVHTITDATQIIEQKADLKTLKDTMSALRTQRVGWSLYVSNNRIERFITSLLHQFAGVRYQTFDTVEEAIEFLKKSDPSLSDKLNLPLDLSAPPRE